MFCLVVMLGMLPVVSFGQNVIYELDNQKSKISIVRYYQNDVDITYSRHGTTVNCFNYVDRANLLYYRADIDLDMNVTDFQIHNDIVFFCGTYRNGVIIGWFKIYSLFFSGGVVNYSTFPTGMTIPFPPYGHDDILSLNRIKVYENGGYIHLFLIGEGQNNHGSANNPHSALIDAWTNDLSSWNFKYTMDYNDEHTYDDLTVTSNYLVVTAHNIGAINPMAPNILYYSLPTAANSIFSTSPVYAPTYWTEYAFISCTDRVLITDMGVDKFATVCSALYMETVPVMVVTYYHNPLTWPIDRYIYTPHSQLNYKEVVYNRQNASLYMLNTKELAKLSSPFTNLDIYTANGPYEWMSIDTLDRNGDAVVSGLEPPDGDSKKLWRFDESIVNECISLAPWNISNEIEYRGDSPKTQYVNDDYMWSSYIAPTVTRDVLKEVCK